MGPNVYSALGSGLLNIGDRAVNFAQLWNGETDRRLRNQQEQEKFDAWKEEQEWKRKEQAAKEAERARQAQKEAAAEQANKDYNKDVASAYEPVTTTRDETNDETQERLSTYDDNPVGTPEGEAIRKSITETRPGQGLTLEQNNALAAKHGLLNPKDFSSGLATQERLNNQNKAAELRNAQFEFNKQRFGEQHALELEKFLFDQEHKGLILNELQRTHKANEWLRSRGLDIEEKKLDQPTAQQKKEEKAAKAFKKLYEWAKANQTWDKDRGATLAYKYNKYKNRGLLSGNGIWGKLGNLAFKDNITDYNAAIKNIISEYEEEYF